MLRRCRKFVTTIPHLQEQLRNFYDNFGTRIAFIRDKRGLTLGQLSEGAASTAKSWEAGSLPRPDQWEPIAKRLGLSVSLVFLGDPKTREDFDFVAKFADEIGLPPKSQAGSSKSSDYRNSGSQDSLAEEPGASRLPKMLDPRFQPRAEPTLQMCKDYIEEYLRRADAQPGGIGYAWVKLQKQFPLDEFEPAEGPHKSP